MASVTFAGVSKRYGAASLAALDGLDLHIEDGEFMVLLGPSGCGKSTALRMIAGLEDITEGQISIGDRVVNTTIPSKRDVSMVFQSYALYPHMSVRKNIESPLLTKPTWVSTDGGEPVLRKLTGAERAERIDEAARMLGLEPYLDRKPGALSGGQRQRVALARAVVARPAAFLMDEPLSNLDAKLRTQTRAELVDLHDRLGTTFVYVTHDQVEAMTMADRIAILSDGRLQQVGTPHEVYDAPANLFVAGFIGTPAMNTARGELRDGAVDLGGSSIPAGPDAADRAAVVIGVRPEHVRVDPSGTIEGEVRQVEWLGHEALLRLRLTASAADAPVDWIARTGTDGSPPVPGDRLRLGIEAGRAHLFDADTGLRLGADAGPASAGVSAMPEPSSGASA